MKDPTPEQTFDAVKYATGKFRVVYGVLSLILGGLVYAATHIYDIGVYMEKARAHEERQDQRISDATLSLKVHSSGRHDSQEKRSAQTTKVLLDHLDTMREALLESAPSKRRSRMRREFRKQRDRERAILLGAE